jgi:peptidoglycan/xylan/chitin deacetylase (PgdA/CDA1 family)
MVRRRLRGLVDRAVFAAGVLSVAERRMRRSLTILAYHRILPEPAVRRYPFPALAIPVDVFREQVAWLAASCRVLPVAEALEESRAAGARGGAPLVAITFDDGYADGFHEAAPILEAHGVRGTFFATVEPIRTAQLLWFDRAALLWSMAGGEAARRALADGDAGTAAASACPAELQGWVDLLGRMDERRRVDVLGRLEAVVGPIAEEVSAGYSLMTVAQAAELAERGHEVASHTLVHPFLTSLPPPRVVEELVESRRVLAGWLGRDVDGFCYPAGDHDEHTVRAVREAGYRYACATGDGPNGPTADPFRLRRYDITCHRVTGDGFSHDALGFRMEISGLRHGIRRAIGRAP